MAYDIGMIRKVYSQMPERVNKLRKLLGRPITLTEKILYSHLAGDLPERPFEKGISYVNFNPDRVAMQDATAQMALLQFMQAGKSVVSVPSTVHCDHLILARSGAAGILLKPKRRIKRFMIFWPLFQKNTALDFGNQALELSIRLYSRTMLSLAE